MRTGRKPRPDRLFSRYRRVAGKELGRELDVLLTDLQTGNQELALQRMEGRVQVQRFLGIGPSGALLSRRQGAWSACTSLQQCSSATFTTKERELMHGLLERPGRIKTACFLLTIEMILMFMVPLVMMIVGTLTEVGF